MHVERSAHLDLRGLGDVPDDVLRDLGDVTKERGRSLGRVVAGGEAGLRRPRVRLAAAHNFGFDDDRACARRRGGEVWGEAKRCVRA